MELATNAGRIRVTATGNGCPSGSWRVRVSEDRTRVTVVFRSFTNRAPRSMRECDLRLVLDGADGISFAPATLTTRGDVDGARRAAGEATISTEVAWEGDDTESDRHALTVRDPFEETLQLDARWSPCSGRRALIVHPRLIAANGTAALEEEEVTFVSRRCTETGPTDASTNPVQASSVQMSAATNCGTVTPEYGATGLNIRFNDTLSLEIPDGQWLSRRSCALRFAPPSGSGKSYAIKSLRVEGAANLAHGTSLDVSVNPSVFGRGWQSNDAGVLQANAAFQGSYAGPVIADVSFPDSELQFTACSSDPLLATDLLLTLQSQTQPPASGHVSIARLGPITFVERPCSR
jgi:hypothetical protein